MGRNTKLPECSSRPEGGGRQLNSRPRHVGRPVRSGASPPDLFSKGGGCGGRARTGIFPRSTYRGSVFLAAHCCRLASGCRRAYIESPHPRCPNGAVARCRWFHETGGWRRERNVVGRLGERGGGNPIPGGSCRKQGIY